jgi:uncharacterized protein YktB (UPF0637 family)
MATTKMRMAADLAKIANEIASSKTSKQFSELLTDAQEYIDNLVPQHLRIRVSHLKDREVASAKIIELASKLANEGVKNHGL